MVTMGTKVEPNSVVEKEKYFNRMDQAYVILCFSISPDLLFHVEDFSTPNKVWTKLDVLFGKHDELRGYLFKNELISLSPNNFETLQE